MFLYRDLAGSQRKPFQWINQIHPNALFLLYLRIWFDPKYNNLALIKSISYVFVQGANKPDGEEGGGQAKGGRSHEGLYGPGYNNENENNDY